VVFNSARLIRYDPDEPQHQNGTRTRVPLNERVLQNVSFTTLQEPSVKLDNSIALY
jgi:hypothetical protein